MAYLQSIEITKSQQAQLDTHIANAKNLVSGKQEVTDLSADEQKQLVSIAKNAGATVGLKVEISNLGDQELTTATISTSNGIKLASLDTQDIMHVVTDTDKYLGEIEETVKDLFEEEIITVVPDKKPGNTNTPNNSTFKPYPGELKPTGLTASAFGLSGLVLAGAGIVLSRKSSK